MPESTATPDVEVVLRFGDTAAEKGTARVATVAVPRPVTDEAVCVALSEADITPADVRSHVEMTLPADVDASEALIIYATLTGFAGRFVTVEVGDSTVEPIHRVTHDYTRPDSPHLVVTAGPAAEFEGQEDEVHFARRVLMDTNQPAANAVRQFTRLAAIRARGEQERFPDCTGASLEEVGAGVVDGDDPDELVSLEAARKAGFTLRGANRDTSRWELAPHAEPDGRLQDLQYAADAPIADVMRRLGSTVDESGERWHCPRPDRHTNGDRNPSMKIVEGKTRCFRCDPEWVDSLRLVMDVKGLPPDEAAAWLRSGAGLAA